jgi:hypothetical protein
LIPRNCGPILSYSNVFDMSLFSCHLEHDIRTQSFPKIDGERKKLRQPIARFRRYLATRLAGEDAPNFPEADLWPGITSGLPFAQNPKVMPDIESKLNLLMVSFARRRGDAAEFVDGVEQRNESFVFRLSVFLALWTISHCEALARVQD